MKLGDYLTLTKPRVAVLVLVTVGVGAFIAGKGSVDPWLVLRAVFGTFLVAGGASALNQLLERDTDSKMHRTENRPLPAGRLLPGQVLAFGLLLGVAGTVFLGVTVNWLTGFLAAITFGSYVFLYTPLKRRTTLNTLVGAIPGALPPVIGWTAVQGEIGPMAWLLFGIVFLWQFPHFLAIAWLYREEYAAAKLKMLPVEDPEGRLTALNMVGYCLVLLPVSLLPAVLGWAGQVYFFGTLFLGIVYLAFAFFFWLSETDASARHLLRASLVYLPGVFSLLLIP